MKDKYKNLILQSITGLSKEQLFLNRELKLSDTQTGLYDSLVSRLESWEPIEYIIQSAEFYGFDFFADSRVLIPRNDSEVMVEQALNIPWEVYIDVWTGSACIPVSLVKSSQQSFQQAYALDISPQALEVAKINIQNHELEDKIRLLESNLLEKILEKNIQDKQILITANLPYIKQDDFENMDASVYLNEPNLALYWWKKTGFELYEKLIWQCQELKKLWNKIVLFIEIGFDQKKVCENFLSVLSLEYETFQDKWGIDRCVRVKI